MALATLSIDLVARLASLEEGMNKATRVAEKNAAQIEARYARIGGAVRAVAGVVATAFAGVSIVNLVRSTVDGVDALNDLKDATGSSIENLSALEDVAARTGTSFEGFSGALVKFNKVLSDAKPGSDFSEIFKRLGLDVERLRALDPAEALRQTAVALSGYADDGNKARTVQELFGKSVKDAAPFLAELAKQGSLVATVTTQQAEEAERFNQQLAALDKNVKDAARELAGALVPAFLQVSNALRGTDDNAGRLTGTAAALAIPLQSLAVLGANVAYVFRQTGEEMGAIAAQGAALASGDIAAFRAIRAERLRDAEEARRQIDQFEARILQLDAKAKPDGLRALRALDNQQLERPSSRGPGGAGGAKRAPEVDEATRALSQYVAQLERERTVTLELSEEQEALNFLKSIGSKGEVPQVRELVLQLAAEVDQRRDLAAMKKLQAEADELIARKQEESRRSLNALIEQTPTAQTDALIQLQQQLNEAFARGSVGGQQYAEALGIIKKRLAEIQDPVKKASTDLDEFSKQAARNIQDALGDTVLATLKGNFADIGRLWGDLIQKMIAQALAARLGQLLLGDFALTGNVGGLFGSFMGMFMHTGGVAEPKRYHTGRSPIGADEVNAVLLKGEEVLPRSDPRHRNNAAGAAAPNVTIVNNVHNGVTRNEVVAMLEMLSNAMRGEFTQRLRLAGVI